LYDKQKQLYPTITTGEVQINGLQYGEDVQVYDVAGVLCRRFNSTASNATINLSTLPTGTYIVKAGNKVGKVVKTSE
jgi:hypothetical protein